ncbi:CHRD domain-containing protein [Sphingomonas sp. NSE70-1]|uniref:CHRD domain-containing protein n=1 Tax=Sphingomonas caseinilyticus TaxID=2908205 RepID=A0ABT0RWI9_9SPHN|nr:CHRD domain-containing protein [Sphingomonas caseinilyticus]MCL6699337.1 CHRD domain-containing protein [Sphingomonas caseinilyticus]
MSSFPRVACAAIAAPALLGAASPSIPTHRNAATYVVALSGQAEVAPSHRWSGDMDGSGQVRLTVDLDKNQICYGFTLSHLATPLMAHIHKGGEHSTGPTVVTLFTGPGGKLDDCVMWVEKWLTEIVANPSDFYVNLYTTEYPDGALRGQLQG